MSRNSNKASINSNLSNDRSGFMDSDWLDDCQHVQSPNFNDRPDPDLVDTLVIHNISLPPGQFGGGHIQSFFCNQLDCSVHPFFEEIANLEVSAHFLIDRDGLVTQFVPLSKRAWHAGASVFDGRANCNDFSIGIEMEGTDTDPYTEQQYKSLAELSIKLMVQYPQLTKSRITGHSDIAPGRKTDPGPAFDWNKYLSMIDDLSK